MTIIQLIISKVKRKFLKLKLCKHIYLDIQSKLKVLKFQSFQSSLLQS